MPKVLVTEPLAQAGLDALAESGEVDIVLRPSPDELVDMIGAYDALIVRSATRVTAEVLEHAPRLQVIGRAGTGVDNIDLAAATRRGVLVVNAPTSNTVAVAEHAIALMLSLARHICTANATSHTGRWDKKRLMGTELRYKTLGLVGLGRVGTAVASRARGLEMRVIAYDPFVSPERAARMDVELVGLDTLFARADYVSLHAPSTESTRGMVDRERLAMMKPTAYLINCARGDLIVEEDLVAALCAGRIAGAALDVYVDEPNIGVALCDCSNLLLTPHLGASTQEAQSSAAVEVSRQVIDVLAGRPARYPVNTTALSFDELTALQPYLDLARQMGRFYAQYTANNVSQIELTYAGEVSDLDTNMVTQAALVGLLSEGSQDHVNLVNVGLVANERGLIVREVRTTDVQGFASLISLRAETTRGARRILGTVMRGEPHIVRVDDYWLDFVARGTLLVSEHIERPGVIGQMGTLLGRHGLDISFVQVGRQHRGGHGLMVTGLDADADAEVMAHVKTLPSIVSAQLVRLT